MKVGWLDDLLALLEEGNFSNAANRRYITQPAFSRRIQSLEDWLGVKLIDRSFKPIGFSIAPDELESAVRLLRDQVFEWRSKIRASCHTRSLIRVGAQQALTISVFPELSYKISSIAEKTSFRIHSGNREDCVAMLLRRSVDILLCYETDHFPAKIPPEIARKVIIGKEELIPVLRAANTRKRWWRGRNGTSLQLLSYPAESFLGKVVRESCLRELVETYDIDVVCESAFSAGLKEMAMQGMGIAWLPRRLIQAELQDKRLRDLSKKLGSIQVQVALFWAHSAHTTLSEEILKSIESIGERQGLDPTWVA